MGDGDGWVHCAAGHRHWGRFGAAGLLLRDQRRTVLQHRAPWTHEGDTWGLPGGARDSHEDPVETALREAGEEAAIGPDDVEPIGFWVDDHVGWSYTTVLARPRRPIDPHAANAESTEMRWWADEDVPGLALHHGLAANWTRLSRRPGPVHLLLDDRDASSDQLALIAPLVGELARFGLAPGELLGIGADSPLTRLLPRVTIATAGPAIGPCGPDGWWRAAIRTAEPGEFPTDGASWDVGSTNPAGGFDDGVVLRVGLDWLLARPGVSPSGSQ